MPTTNIKTPILHLSPNKFICNSCSKIFNSNSHLTQHKNKKNPCFMQLYSNINNNLGELNKQHETIEGNPIIGLSIVSHKPLNDFMATYQNLVTQSQSTQLVVIEYQKKNKELLTENIRYKSQIKSILQIINSKKDVVDDYYMNHPDELIILPPKIVADINVPKTEINKNIDIELIMIDAPTPIAKKYDEISPTSVTLIPPIAKKHKNHKKYDKMSPDSVTLTTPFQSGL